MLDNNQRELLRKTYITTIIISVSIFLSLIFYVVLVYFFNQNFQVKNISSEQSKLLQYILGTIAVATVGAVYFLKQFLFSDEKLMARAGNNIDILCKTFITNTILLYALCESIAICGLAIFFITHSINTFYLFTAISVLSMILCFPILSIWEEKANKIIHL